MIGLYQMLGLEIPSNEEGYPGDVDLVKRKRDCWALNAFLSNVEDEAKDTGLEPEDRPRPYDSVRGAFSEGAPLFEGSKIMEKSHVQICVRNAPCIRGYFRPNPHGGL